MKHNPRMTPIKSDRANHELIRVDNVSRIYRTTRVPVIALKNVSCSFSRGEFTAICGRSGAGKSTLLQIIGGLERPDEGQIWLGGDSLFERSDSALAKMRGRQISFIFQAYNLVKEMTLIENCRLPLDLAGKPYNRAMEEELLTDLGLTARRDHYPNELSGGEQQRTAIARAILSEPDVILADEPTGNLDEENGQIFMKLMHQMNQRYQVTVIMITHDLGLARQCDRVITLGDGEIISDQWRTER